MIEPAAHNRAASQRPGNTGLSPGPRPKRAAAAGACPLFEALSISR